MELNLDTGGGRYLIRSYETGKVVINDQTYTQSLIVTPTTLIYPWAPRSLAEITPEHLEIILAQNPEVVILGTGDKLIFPEAKLLAPLINNNIGFEVMDNGAACRTFNVLTAEGRKVVAGLLL